MVAEEWWNLYDNLWIILCQMNGKAQSKVLPKSSSAVGPTFGQRARGLVESLNIPAAEMAAVVVSGGLSNALGGKPNKIVDKAMLLKAEKCPRTVSRLVILYLCRSSLERASRCVQQVIPLLPYLLAADDEQSKSRLQLFIWALLAVRSQHGMQDDGARFHVISHLIRETVNCGKPMLATSIMGRDESSDLGSNPKETGTLQSLIQKDRVLSAVADEVKYIKTSKSDRTRQLNELRIRMDENSSLDSNQKKAFEDEILSRLNTILASDDSRRAHFQLAHDEEQQIVAPPCCSPDEDSCDLDGICKDCTTCFLHSDLDNGRPSTAQFKEKLPWFLNALPSADCAKGGHGAYTSSVDLNGYESGVIQASEFRTYHTPLRKQDDFVNSMRAAREFSSRVSDSLKIEIFPYSVFYIFFEQYLDIWETAVINIAIALGAVFLVCLVITSRDVQRVSHLSTA